MGRHETDPIPFRDMIRDSGPMKRIRNDASTEVIPSAEVRRRAWPTALLIGAVVTTAVALPVALSILSAEESPTPIPSAVSDDYSPEPDRSPSPSRSVHPAVRPTVTVTKNRIEYKTEKPEPKPGPTVTRTIYVTPSPIKVPGPKITVRVTIKPKPEPAVTETETIIQDRCFRVRNGIITGEISCP